MRHTVEKAIRDFFDERGFTLVDAPIFTPSACEGTSTLFEVPYFDLGKAYLTQSGQLYMEAAAMALGKVYCFGPTFRAEKSKTRRHLTEFWMVEPEVAYMDLDGDMELMEEFVSYVVAGGAREAPQGARDACSSATSRSSRSEAAVPAHHLHRGGRGDPHGAERAPRTGSGSGHPLMSGARTSAATRRRSSRASSTGR